jgi:hypothetical protein
MPAHLRRLTWAKKAKATKQANPQPVDSKKETVSKEVKKAPKEKVRGPLNKKVRKKRTI